MLIDNSEPIFDFIVKLYTSNDEKLGLNITKNKDIIAIEGILCISSSFMNKSINSWEPMIETWNCLYVLEYFKSKIDKNKKSQFLLNIENLDDILNINVSDDIV